MSDLTPELLDQIEKATSAMPTFWGTDVNGIYDRDKGGDERYLALIHGSDAVSREYFCVMDPATTLALIARVRELESRGGRVVSELEDELHRSRLNDPPNDANTKYQEWLDGLILALTETS